MTEDFDKLVDTYRESLSYEVDDEELGRAVSKAINESEKIKKYNDEVGARNYLYWKKGTKENYEIFHPNKAKVVVNRIFTDVETAIPLITSEMPEPTILGTTNEQQSQIQRALEAAYEVENNMNENLQHLVRHLFLYRIGIWKYFWDKRDGRKFVTKRIMPKRMGFDPMATNLDNAEYCWELKEDKIDDLIEMFPKAKKTIEGLFGIKNGKSKVTYTEFWGGGGEWTCWTLYGKILDKVKNPNFDYEDEENNLFDRAMFPYLILNCYNVGDNSGIYDETSLIEQASSMQEAVNKIEQQIIDLNEGLKRVWVVHSDGASEKKAQDLVNKTGDLLVYLDRGAPSNAISQVQSGRPDNAIFEHLNHLLGEIDNIIGIHSVTRGQRVGQETLGGKRLMLGSDNARMDIIVRNIEQVIERWYMAYLHINKVFAEPGTKLVLQGMDGEVELDPSTIPRKIKVMVKRGSTLSIDRPTKQANALKMAELGTIDPETLFEEMGYPNPEKRVQALIAWMTLTGKITAPQPQVPPAGLPPQGDTSAGQEDHTPDESAARIEQIVNSDQFKALPPEQQATYIAQFKEIMNKVK